MKTIRILVADDEAEIRMTMEIVIERMGFTALSAGNGFQALQVLEEHRNASKEIDLLLCDIRMPLCTGEGLLVEMHRRELHTPVVMISGDTDRDLIHRMMDAGCIDFIEKPFSVISIEDKLSRIVHNIFSERKDEM